MTKNLALATVLLAFLVIGNCQYSSSWDQWVLPTWAPNWTPSPSWSVPSTPSGFRRNVIGQSSNPASNNFNLRLNHYLYESTSLGGNYQVSCGPESYMVSTSSCSRKPYYWAPNYPSTCVPDLYINRQRKACEVEKPAGTNCCYASNQNDLFDVNRVSQLYPPGA